MTDELLASSLSQQFSIPWKMQTDIQATGGQICQILCLAPLILNVSESMVHSKLPSQYIGPHTVSQ